MGYGSGITLVIAVLFIIIDTQLVIKDAENDNFDVFQHARMLTLGIKINWKTNLNYNFVDFLKLFYHILRILLTKVVNLFIRN